MSGSYYYTCAEHTDSKAIHCTKSDVDFVALPSGYGRVTQFVLGKAQAEQKVSMMDPVALAFAGTLVGAALTSLALHRTSRSVENQILEAEFGEKPVMFLGQK